MSKAFKIIIILGLLLACGIVGVWYVNKFILPVKVKDFVVKYLEEKTGRDVTIESMTYLPPNQFYLNNVTLYDNQRPSLNIKRLSCNLQIWPLLKDKNVIARVGLKDLTYGGIKINGVADLLLKQLASPARRPMLNNLDGTIKFTDFSVVSNVLPDPIENITGVLTLEDNHIDLNKTFVKYKDMIFNLEGALTDLDKDQSLTRLLLSSDLLTSAGTFVVKDNHIQIKELGGKFLNSSFNIRGDVTDLRAPQMNLHGNAQTDLADLKKLFPKSKYILDSLKPEGLCKASLFFNGSIKNLMNSEAGIKLSSGKIFLHGLALDDLYVDLRMKNGIIKTQSLSLSPYLGRLNASFNMDLNKKESPYSISFVLEDVNLRKFSRDTNLGKEDISGLISSKFFLQGYLSSIDALRGSGWIIVKNGRLWQIPLLSGVSDLLALPHLRSISFKEAAGNFVIGQRKVSTDDLTFYSERVNMVATGHVDFDGNIDALIQTNITEDLIEGTSDSSVMANLILSQAGDYMGRIRVTGTVKEPQYRLSAKPMGEILQKEIRGLLENILQ